MSKFDKAINDALVIKIKRGKQKIKNKLRRIKPPNTPGNRPVSQCSPALRKGINQDIADTPMPMGVGV